MPPLVLAATQPAFILRVCTGKVCKKQGSPQIAQFGKDLHLPDVDVQTGGCLSACGNGPNVALIPTDGTAPLVLRHVGTPRRMADLLRDVCGQAAVDEPLLMATEMRLAGNDAARRGDLREAEKFYTVGLQAQASVGRHLLLSNRSGVRLELGNAEAALEDADAAAACCPPDFTTAAIRQVEALLRMGRHRQAMECLLAARERHPPFAQSPDYKMVVSRIQVVLEKAGAK